MKSLSIFPPLLNTACPWCSDIEQLRTLYRSPYTGAVTTRTSMLNGFPHNSDINQFVLFNPLTLQTHQVNSDNNVNLDQLASLNTIGFSPTPLSGYLDFILTISDELPDTATTFKPFIISVTGTAEEIAECYAMINRFQPKVKMDLMMEMNLSCPNIPGKVSPAYDSIELLSYLNAIKQQIIQLQQQDDDHGIPVGIKLPPFTYQEQYDVLFTTLVACATDSSHPFLPIRFITSTNTLGSSLVSQVVDNNAQAVLRSMAGNGIGGLAGAAIHPLSLGNVYMLRQGLKQNTILSDIQLIGVGGVNDFDGYIRMKSAGADIVGIATALGVKGVEVFAEISK